MDGRLLVLGWRFEKRTADEKYQPTETASKNSEIKKDEEHVLEKEDVSESKLEIEHVRTDPDRLQSMTVKDRGPDLPYLSLIISR
ncbi:hypothetical protein ABZP36_027772 [Zizania latifolia]